MKGGGQNEFVPFSIETLLNLFAQHGTKSPQSVKQKYLCKFLADYLASLGAKTIVVEHPYTDRDFLEDYSAYYVRCHKEYPRICTRLHFFREAFTEEDWRNRVAVLRNIEESAQLSESFLGFIVVKPLPRTIIGRSCLSTYPAEGGRCFPLVRQYSVNLFGIDLKVESLAFQEQDSVTAACATSALWTVFHGTGKQFQHAIPSPIEITRAATASYPAHDRSIPSKGLSLDQISHGIRSVGLEPISRAVGAMNILRTTVYAYLRGKVPVLLVFRLFDVRVHPNINEGTHGVAITGYHLAGTCQEYEGHGGFQSRAAHIDKLYTHDDQVGPFAKMEFDGLPVVYRDKSDKDPLIPEGKAVSLSTSWGKKWDEVPTHRAVPLYLVVPLYHKIRIPFEAVYDLLVRFDSFFKALAFGVRIAFPEPLEWDIFLTSTNYLKRDVLKMPKLSKKRRQELLFKSMPRFIWRATASFGGEPAVDLLFDATDIEQSQFLFDIIEHNRAMCKLLHDIAAGVSNDEIETTQHGRILRWFRDNNLRM